MNVSKGGSLLIAAISFVAANAAAQTYKVVDLATLAQGNATVVRGPNNAGAAWGGGTVDGARGATRARSGFILQAQGAQQISGLAGSDDTVVFGLNDVGGYVGGSNTATAIRAFAAPRVGGAVRQLPPLGGDTASIAYALNNLGQAVGLSSGAGGQRAVIWDASGAPAALPGSAGLETRATGINERGDVSGVRTTVAGQRPILWPGGQAPAELKLLAGHTTGEASAIDARGDVVGYSASASGVRRATLWPWSGGVVDLGPLPGGDFSQAFGSNGVGDVVGVSTSSVGSRAVLWTRGGVQDLNSLIAPSAFVLTKAVGITAGGAIIAIGHDPAPGHRPAAVGGQGIGVHPHDVDEHDLAIRVFLLIRSGGTP